MTAQTQSAPLKLNMKRTMLIGFAFFVLPTVRSCILNHRYKDAQSHMHIESGQMSSDVWGVAVMILLASSAM